MSDESGYDNALSANYKETINQTTNSTINALMWQAGGEVGVAIYGYLFPSVAVITFFTNALSVFILTQNITPINLMLITISVYDWVTCLVPQPMNVFLLHLNNLDWVPYEWCTTFKVTFMYIPGTFHTASLWTTVFMAAQRYFVVRKPFLKRLVTKKLTLVLISVALAIGFAVNSLRMFDSSFEPVVVPSKQNSSVLMTGCVEKYAQWIADPTSYFSTFFIVKTSFQNFLPSITLLILNFLLIREVSVKKRLRSGHKAALSVSANQVKSLESTSTRITTMLIAILIANLCVEIPVGFMYAVIVASQFGFSLLSPEAFSVGALVVDTLMQFSYSINFVIYCTTSTNFRKTFLRVFCPSAVQVARVRMHGVNKTSNTDLNSVTTNQDSDLHM